MKKFLLSSLMGVWAVAAAPDGLAQEQQDVWQMTFDSIDGGSIRLADYEGKVVMVVNTASKCGFTPQYKGLQALWDRYRYKGLVVIGIPSNDFANQEPDDEATIKQMCELRYGVTFPLSRKEVVTGGSAHPFYRWAADKVGRLGKPHWNFHKYIIAPDGRLAAWFTGITKPESDEMINTIELLLDEVEMGHHG